MSRPIYERGPHKELANLQQQNIVNENIIEQLQIRIQQDEKKIRDLELRNNSLREELIELRKEIKDHYS